MALIGFLHHQAVEWQLVNTAEGKQPGLVSTKNSQLHVSDPIAVTLFYFFSKKQEKTPLTRSVLFSDTHVTRKAEVLQAETQLKTNKSRACSCIHQGAAPFAPCRRGSAKQAHCGLAHFSINVEK